MIVDMTPSCPPAAACGAPTTGFDDGLAVDRLATVAKALSDPLRISLLDVLRRHGAPLCQCELMPLLDISQSTLSHHMRKLVGAGLVCVERRHRWAYYTACPEGLTELSQWIDELTTTIDTEEEAP